MGLFCKKVTFLPLENTECYAIYLSMGSSFSLRNNVGDPPHSHFESYSQRHTVLVPFTGIEVFGTQVNFLSFGNLEM
jgi:hypothetical protein